MAPIEKDSIGYWGPPTSTIDWCEANYQVSFYIAEYWNTVSNLFMVIPPLFGAYFAYKDGLESRFIFCHLGLMVVGLGSSMFHGTLLYEMQLMDEIPMIWGSNAILYSLIEIDGKPKSQNKRLQFLLILYSIIVTIVYVLINEPVFHEAAYGLMVLAMVFYSIRIVRNHEHSYTLFLSSMLTYGMGFIIWNLDHMFCPTLRRARSHLPGVLQPVTQGHAWWHMFAGIGTYLGLIFCTHARLRYLKKPEKIQVAYGIFPYIRSLEGMTSKD